MRIAPLKIYAIPEKVSPRPAAIVTNDFSEIGVGVAYTNFKTQIYP
jgi:hypothetical protein